MSAIDRLVTALSPPETPEQRDTAHARARADAQPNGWLSLILDHHETIVKAFAVVRAAPEGVSRQSALKQLEVLLTGHAIAEEAVVYPALAQVHEPGWASQAYNEQAGAKQMLAALERMNPTSRDFLDKLGQLETAVRHHLYEEESRWLPELEARAGAAQNEWIAVRYKEEFARYMGEDAGLAATPARRAAESRSFVVDGL
jgi:hemerythrin-like domain-containing protein